MDGRSTLCELYYSFANESIASAWLEIFIAMQEHTTQAGRTENIDSRQSEPKKLSFTVGYFSMPSCVSMNA